MFTFFRQSSIFVFLSLFKEISALSSHFLFFSVHHQPSVPNGITMPITGCKLMLYTAITLHYTIHTQSKVAWNALDQEIMRSKLG